MRSPWRLRTRFGEDVLVLRDWDVRKDDPAERVPAFFVRGELRDWLLRWDSFERRKLLEMYGELQGFAFGRGGGSPDHLERYVLPALEEAFQRGTLVALKAPKLKIPT